MEKNGDQPSNGNSIDKYNNSKLFFFLVYFLAIFIIFSKKKI